ncbi:MAG: fused MFS/spermidine synthase, partial [Armatimonadetes bacterium]|nr:fused MFS/spermidine synthase [Armatimonadota bacterium]
PICVKLATTEVGKVGRSVGSLYVTSTVGSCVGTLVTGFVLIPFIGTQVSTALLTTVLVSMGFIHIARKPWSQVLAIAAFVTLGVACMFPMFMRPREKRRNPACRDQRKQIGLAVQMYRDTYEASRSSLGSNQRLMAGAIQSGVRLFRRDSLCGRLEVWTTDKQRLLLVDGMLQTAMPSDPSAVAERNHLFPEHYWAELLPYFRPKARNALLIGLGGGLLPQVLRSYGIETEAVEVDPVIVEVARRYFGYAGPATIDDGRHFLSTTRQKYDFVILDAFTGDHPPSHMLTLEALREARRVLKEDGILAINIADVPKAGRILSALENTLSPLFDNCMELGTDESNRVQLFTMFVTEGSLAPRPVYMGPHVRPTTEDLQRITPFIQQRTGIGSSTVLRDDRNPFDVLYAPVALEWRRATADLLGY